MSYAAKRNLLNLQIGLYEGEGEYNIPKIKGMELEDWRPYWESEILPFNVAMAQESGAGKAVHFYLDDYRFERIWAAPVRYVGQLSKFDYILSPDFSLFTDFPKALQIYNHYRKHWVAAYMEENGVNVVPTIAWSNKDSYEWCFDGEPKDSVVSVSAIGCADEEDSIARFNQGYMEMLSRLSPKMVIYFGRDILTSENRRAVMCVKHDGYADRRWYKKEEQIWAEEEVVAE